MSHDLNSSVADAGRDEKDRLFSQLPGVLPKVLDIIRIPVIAAAPKLYQTESYVIDAEYYWDKKGEVYWADVQQFVDRPEPLWTNGDSSYYGLNDRVKVDTASKLRTSLMLIEPEDLTITVATEGTEFGNPRRRVRADFGHVGKTYRLIVTDPVAERALFAKPNAEYRPRNTYLCISLGEPHEGSCYKLVAAVISKQPL